MNPDIETLKSFFTNIFIGIIKQRHSHDKCITPLSGRECNQNNKQPYLESHNFTDLCGLVDFLCVNCLTFCYLHDRHDTSYHIQENQFSSLKPAKLSIIENLPDGHTTSRMEVKWKRGFDKSDVTENNSISLAQVDVKIL